jgi:hypothetical protein
MPDDMNAQIVINKIWFDNDVVELQIRVCDGVSRFSNRVYVGHEVLATVVADLNTFKLGIHGGIYDMNFGAFGPEYANGGFTARLHFYPVGRLKISTYQQSEFQEFTKNKVASEARLYLKSEPALLDRFILELASISADTSDEASLECV